MWYVVLISVLQLVIDPAYTPLEETSQATSFLQYT